MKRRDFMVGLWAVAIVGGAQAQQSGKVHRIAVVSSSGSAAHLLTSDWPMWDEFRRLGYVEGQNLVIERFCGEGRAAHYPDLARDVVRRNPDVIIAFGNELVLDFKAATSTIPIVAVFGGAVEAGIVQSLARPGGNITGVSVDIGDDQWGKRIQLLRHVVPQATRVALLISHEADQYIALVGEAFRMAGATLVRARLDYPINEAEYRRAFAAFAQDGAEGIVVDDGYENWEKRGLIAELAEKHRLPAIYPFRDCVDAGGLMSYGVSIEDSARRVAGMVVQILKGAKPPDIPVLQPRPSSNLSSISGRRKRSASPCRWNYVQSPTMRSTAASSAVIIPFRIATDRNSVVNPFSVWSANRVEPGLAHLPFAANSRIPVMYAAREGVELGGLVSYGVNLPDLSRATAIYLDSVHDVRPRSPDWVNEDARVI